jgi:epoxyqueuosine reductase
MQRTHDARNIPAPCERLPHSASTTCVSPRRERAGSTPLRAWLDAGHHARCTGWSAPSTSGSSPQLVLPGARSIDSCSASTTGPRGLPAAPAGGPGRPGPVRAARGLSRHDQARAGGGRAVARGDATGARRRDYRYYVDTGPVLERSWAARAGLGFTGKNAMLISRRHGNWLFLAAILTKVAFVADEPIRKRGHLRRAGDVGLLCGKCTRCLDACPTQAFAAPGVVDARRCVSYQTIENKGVIPRELRAGHRHADLRVRCLPRSVPVESVRAGGAASCCSRRATKSRTLALKEILELTPVRFAEVFRRTAIKRVKLGGLLRNACVVAGNSGDARCCRRWCGWRPRMSCPWCERTRCGRCIGSAAERSWRKRAWRRPSRGAGGIRRGGRERSA